MTATQQYEANENEEEIEPLIRADPCLPFLPITPEAGHESPQMSLFPHISTRTFFVAN